MPVTGRCARIHTEMRTTFVFHKIKIQNDGGSLGLVIALKTHSCLSHLIKRESLMLSLRQYWRDFPIFTMIDSKFHFSPIFTSNLFFWTRNKNDICLKHMTSSTLVKCNSMIISIVMPSYPNVTLFLCYISEHWTSAHTLNMTINHKFPKPDNIKHNPKNHVSHLSIHKFAHRALWFNSDWLKLVIYFDTS